MISQLNHARFTCDMAPSRAPASSEAGLPAREDRPSPAAHRRVAGQEHGLRPPSTTQTREDLAWTLREIRQSGGDAQLFESRIVDGLSDGELQQRFQAAREADYAPLLKRARALAARAKRSRNRDALARDIAKLRAEAESIRAIDFFDAPAGQTTTALLDAATRELEREGSEDATPPPDYRGRVWVTRTGVHVDRMASAWLIRRFIDPEATFKFAKTRKDDEIGFDMFDAEFTHEGNRCTFEVLLDRFRLVRSSTATERALRAIAEVVHDIDLKDGKLARGDRRHRHGRQRICLAHRDDDEARVPRRGRVRGLVCLLSQEMTHSPATATCCAWPSRCCCCRSEKASGRSSSPRTCRLSARRSAPSDSSAAHRT
jgi:hypothetical protein